jgi:hypothetical protein
LDGAPSWREKLPGILFIPASTLRARIARINPGRDEPPPLRDKAVEHTGLIPAGPEDGEGTSIEVDNIDAALKRVKKAGIAVEYGPTSEPWGVRRFYAPWKLDYSRRLS